MPRPILLSVGICAFACAQVVIDEQLEGSEERTSMGGASQSSGDSDATIGPSSGSGGDGPLFKPTTAPTEDPDAPYSGGSSSAFGGAFGGDDPGAVEPPACMGAVAWTPDSPCSMTVDSRVLYEGVVYRSLYSHSYCHGPCSPSGAEAWCAGQQEYVVDESCSP